MIIGPDIPMLPHQLKRLAKHASIGIGSSGSPGENDSGDIFLAFSTANEMSVLQKEVPILNMKFTNDQQFDPIYEKTCHAIDEAIINAMIAADSMSALKPSGEIVEAVDHEQLMEVMKKYNR